MANYNPPDYLQMRSTNTVGVSGGIKCMVYGGAGVGKTRLLATAPDVLILSAEQGLLSLREYNLPFIMVKTMADLDYLYNQLLNNKRQYGFVRTVGLDSVSEIAETLLNDLKSKNTNHQRAYGEMAQDVLAMLRKFRDMPNMNIVFIAKQGRIKDESTGAFMFGPFMPGQQLDQHMPYMFDEVFQLNQFKNQDGSLYGALRTRRDSQNEAKDRSGALDEWERPNLSAIFHKIAQGRN